jgi:hypothetical protein
LKKQNWPVLADNRNWHQTSLAGQKPLWQLEKSRESYHTLFLDSLYALAHAKPSENTLVHAPDKDDNEPNHQANDENPADPSDESHRAHGSTHTTHHATSHGQQPAE